MASTFLATMSLLITQMVSASSTTTAAIPSPQTISSDIANTVQEMQQARYFTFVMLVRMVQEKIPHNTTFLMLSDRLMSTASISQSQVLEFLSRHSIAAPLKFNDLIRLPNGTVIPTRHSGDTITVTSSRHQKLYFNGIELTSPDLCHSGVIQVPWNKWSHKVNSSAESKSSGFHSLCCSNFCSTRDTFGRKPILEHIFSTISQHRFCHDPCP